MIHSRMVHSRLARSLALIVPIMLLTSCSSISNMLQGDKLDYKSAASAKVKSLEVPPDLSSLPRDDRFNIPSTGTATLSGYNSQRASAGGPVAAGSGDILPVVKDARMERAGGQRWLVVDKNPEELYPLIREFWQDNGFLIKTESPATGIMETDWAENRAKIPQDFIRETLGKVIDGLYSTGERDKFRTRIERRPDGGSEIYISHRGMIEVLTGTQKETTVWTPRPSDPELEAEFLRRLLVRLGVDTERSKTVVASSSPTGAAAAAQAPRSSLVVAAAGSTSYVEITDPFDRAWRRVGLALDRVGFTVEDRDRVQGIYFVRYVDPESDGAKPGLFARIFTSAEERSKLAAQYRILVKTGASDVTRITVLNKDGGPDTGETGTRILKLLNEQLK